GRALTNPSAGQLKSRSPITTSTGQETAASAAGSSAPGERRMQAARAAASFSPLSAKWAKAWASELDGSALPSMAWAIGSGSPDRDAEQDRGAQADPHRVDLPVGRQGVPDPGAEVAVGRRVVGLGCGAVTEQVDTDHLAAGVLQQRHPTGLAPVALEGGGEA